MNLSNYASSVKRLLEEEGWIQGEDFDGTGYCMMGALKEIRKREGWTPQAVLEFKYALDSKVGDFNIIMWNDAPKRTKEEVIELVESFI